MYMHLRLLTLLELDVFLQGQGRQQQNLVLTRAGTPLTSFTSRRCSR